MEKCWEQNTYIHNLFIDFQAAFDTVWRKEIWCEMHKIGFTLKKKKVQLCTILNNEIQAKVKIAKHLSSEFKVNKDLRQGDAIAPLEISISRSKVETREPYLTNVAKLWHMLMKWLLWEQDC